MHPSFTEERVVERCERVVVKGLDDLVRHDHGLEERFLKGFIDDHARDRLAPVRELGFREANDRFLGGHRRTGGDLGCIRLGGLGRLAADVRDDQDDGCDRDDDAEQIDPSLRLGKHFSGSPCYETLAAQARLVREKREVLYQILGL